MDEPPRRRRRYQPTQASRSLPMIPIVAVVVALGFALGAAISIFAHRDAGTPGAGPSASAPLAAVTLAPQASEAPEATERPEPRERASFTPLPATPSPATTPTSAPTASASASPAALAAAPTPLAEASAAPSARPSAPPTPRPSAPAAVAVVQTAPPRATPRPIPATPAATTAPRVSAAQTPSETADSDFARLSASVVRGYLSALARGDDAAAQAALDAPAGSRAASLSEKEFAGPDMRVSNVQAHGTGDSARVDVDVVTAKGTYFAQFFLKKSAAGTALIVNHDFIKP